MSSDKNNKIISEFPSDTFYILNAGTVSAGKSTLVNAFAGEDIMPTSNLSCTSLAVTVVDFPNDNSFPAGIYYDGKQMLVYQTNDEAVSELNKYNKSNSANGDFIVRTKFKKMSNGVYNIAIIDTPGVNDSLNESNNSIAYQQLNKLGTGIILYVSNLKSCGTTDDEECFKKIAEIINKNSSLKLIVVVNGWDLANEKTETRNDYDQKIFIMSRRCGIQKPQVFYISAMAAALARKALSKQPLTDIEEYQLERILRSYGLSSKIPDRRYDDRCIGNKALRTVVYKSGVSKLEEFIYQTIIQRKE